MNYTKSLQKLALLGFVTLPLAASALTLSESGTAPDTATTPIFQAAFDGGLNGGTDYSDNNGTPGQTFTTGALPLSVTAITTKGAGSFGGFDIARFFVLSIASSTGTTSGTLTRVRQEVSQAFIPSAGDSYLTFTLDSPLLLAANSIYEYDIYTTDNPNPAQQSANGGFYGFAKSANDVLPNGTAMQNGFQGSNSRFSADPGSVNTPQTSDRTFYVTAVPEPSSVAMIGLGLGGCAMFALRRKKASV